jgi:glycine oxidase
MRTTVVGGGIVGSFTAFFLARAGVDVTVVERSEIGRHASGNNPGGLNPLYGPGIPGALQDFSLEAFRLHLDHWDEIAERSGIVFSGRRKQRLNLAVDDDDMRRLAAMKHNYDAVPGFRADWLDGDAARALEPRLAGDLVGGLLAEGDAKVDAPSYTRAVLGAAVSAGATVVQADVVRLGHGSRGVTQVETSTGAIPCDAVVVATGPWCEAPELWTGVALPMEPVKGEMLLVEAEGGGTVNDIAWRESAVYQTGGLEVWLGGTEDHVGFDDSTTEAARSSIVERVSRVFPAMARAGIVRQTAGLRPLTPDGLPIVGLVGGGRDVCVALGGGRKGMLFSAAMGRASADLLLEGRTAVPVAACAPERFADAPAGGVR